MLEDHLRKLIKKDERLTGRTVGLFSFGRIALLNDQNTSWMATPRISMDVQMNNRPDFQCFDRMFSTPRRKNTKADKHNVMLVLRSDLVINV